MNSKKSEHASLKKNNNEGKFIELARKKAFQKKGKPKRNILHMPLTNKINESGKFYLILELNKDYGRGAILFKKRGREASFFLKILRLG